MAGKTNSRIAPKGKRRNLDAPLIDLGRRLAECEARKAALYEAGDEDAHDRAYTDHWDLRNRIAKTQATTLKVKAQAAALAHKWCNDPFLGGSLDLWESIAHDLGATPPNALTQLADCANALKTPRARLELHNPSRF